VINQTDTVFLILSSALVMLMTPGLALFYGGMTRKRDVLGMMLQSFLMFSVVSLVWILWGYSLAFGPDKGGLIGSLSWLGLKGISLSPSKDYASTVPHLLFVLYQMMFAVITVALITGAIAGRFKFKSLLLFSLLWSTFVYSPIAHWVWGNGGWIGKLGALDFAGGTVVHLASGAAALAAVLVVKKRRDFPQPLRPHNLTLTVLGTGLLWFGWFGFNGGSALAAGKIAVLAMFNTHLAASSAALSWLLLEWLKNGKPTSLGFMSGAVAGLVAITPACGFVGIGAAVVIGLLAGGLCQFAVELKYRFGYDDTLDVVGIHGVGGAFGALATGLFASRAVNPSGVGGLLAGNSKLILAQLISVVAAGLYSFVVTLVILLVVKALVGVRVSEGEEEIGLDISEHGEVAYHFE
jgi:Amt family ammonium transporter